jgi:hypothetical protein
MAWGDSLIMSQSAREILMKAIAQAVRAYVMGVFKLPFSLCDELTKPIRDYWWGVERGKRKTHWVNWNTMTHSKAQGGMGFRDMRLFNQALLARQAWRLITFQGRLLSKRKYHCYCFHREPILLMDDHLLWAGVTEERYCVRVGNGRSLQIWRDRWLPRISNDQVLTPKKLAHKMGF